MNMDIGSSPRNGFYLRWGHSSGHSSLRGTVHLQLTGEQHSPGNELVSRVVQSQAQEQPSTSDNLRGLNSEVTSHPS